MSVVDRVARMLARRRLARLRALASDPREVQARVLGSLLERAAPTAFGREHGFAAIRSQADLARAVPLRDYTGMAPYWDRARDGEPDVCWPGRIRYWALSSGTTAGEKFLPVSEDTIRGDKAGGFDCMVPCLAQGEVAPFSGKLLFLGGCTDLRREGGNWVGDKTGIMTLHIPWFIRHWHRPAPEICRIPDWEKKIREAADACWDLDVRMISGVPSWIALFCEQVLTRARATGRRVRNLGELWPNLGLFVHGGVGFQPYRRRFADLIGRPIWYTDSYSASEGGVLSVQDRRDDPAMLPILDQGVFFEFVPAAELGSATPTRVPIKDVELDVDYAVVLNTDSGIFGYLVGDLVRFVSRDPLRLLFAGRIRHTLNAFGEHVSSGELDRAIGAAAREAGLETTEFAVTTRFPDQADPTGWHRWYVEFPVLPPDLGAFASAIDRAIQAGNEDYATHRTYGMGMPEIVPVPTGGFYDWMRARGKFGGQNKVPRVLERALEDSLRGFLGTRLQTT